MNSSKAIIGRQSKIGLYEKRPRHNPIGGGIGRGVGKPKVVSAKCKNNKCSECFVLRCIHSCHERFNVNVQ